MVFIPRLTREYWLSCLDHPRTHLLHSWLHIGHHILHHNIWHLNHVRLAWKL